MADAAGSSAPPGLAVFSHGHLRVAGVHEAPGGARGPDRVNASPRWASAVLLEFGFVASSNPEHAIPPGGGASTAARGSGALARLRVPRAPSAAHGRACARRATPGPPLGASASLMGGWRAVAVRAGAEPWAGRWQLPRGARPHPPEGRHQRGVVGGVACCQPCPALPSPPQHQPTVARLPAPWAALSSAGGSGCQRLAPPAKA